MRGLRCPVDGYALPAVPPEKKQAEIKHEKGVALTICASICHSAELCCKARGMSTIVYSVTAVTKCATLASVDKQLV